MEDLVGADWPFAAVWLFFLSGALARGGVLHWLGRRARRLGEREGGRPRRPSVRRAERLVERFGAPAVTLSFLTLGVQSAVNVASGLLRMPPARFVPALLVGAAIWATIYATVGMSVVYAALGRLDWRWLLGVALLVVLVLVATRAAGHLAERRSARRDSRSTQANGTRSTT